jgi:hypothetical protein
MESLTPGPELENRQGHQTTWRPVRATSVLTSGADIRWVVRDVAQMPTAEVPAISVLPATADIDSRIYESTDRGVWVVTSNTGSIIGVPICRLHCD